jgi:hypothetical protein
VSSSQPTGPELRIGDSEREAAVAALGDHYAAGRLTKEEYDERAARAWEARTRSALWPLFSDLPRPQSERPDAPTADAGGGAPYGRGYHSAPHWGWRFGGGLVPVLIVFVVIVVTKTSRYWGHSGRRHHGSWQH